MAFLTSVHFTKLSIASLVLFFAGLVGDPFVVTAFCQRDGREVPFVPRPGLVATDQDDRFSLIVEDKQQPDLRLSGHSGTQLLKVMQAAGRNGSDPRAADPAPVPAQRVDRSHLR